MAEKKYISKIIKNNDTIYVKDTEAQTVLDSAAYLEDGDSQAIIADFDPQTDTVWKKQQTLSVAEKAQVRTNIDVYGKSETYTKTEVNGLVDTPHQNYVTVATYASLPASGSEDTIYRVSSYDGVNSQVDDTVYSEYAWDGTQYVFLCVKSQIGEVFDISAYNNNAKYADLAAALGTNGANVPETLRKGGMSVKFVQSSDNKYVQFRYMSSSTAVADFTNVANWQGIDDEPTAGSDNLVKSGGAFQSIEELKEQVYLDVFGEVEIEKSYIWSDGYVAGQSILNSTLSKFCQPVLFKSGEKLSYKTNTTYGSAVIQVADDTPLSVGSTNFYLQTLINAMEANQEYEYTFEQDMWIVISVLKSDYSLKAEKFSDNSVNDRVEHLEDISSPKFTSNSSLNAIFDELYINGFFEGLYISYFVWNGTKVTAILRDSQDNIVWFANGLDATIGSVFSFSQNGITLYALLNSTTHLISPIVATLQLRSLNIRYNPQIFDYIVNSKTDMEYPINVSRFDQGGMLPTGHKASWITISRRMDDEFDSVFNFANKTYPNLTNKWFDFYAVGKHARGQDGVSKCNTYIDWDGINGLSTSDALMMAVIVGAVNNIDGDNPTIKWHTGGAHAYGDSATGATPTMRELSNTVLADGKLVPVGKLNVKCKKLTIDVINNVQGYNTCKEDGTGREIVQQRYHVEVTNDYCEVVTELVALEEVIVYGSNVVTGIGMSNMQYRFIGSDSKRGLYTYNGNENVPSNGDSKIDTLRVEKDGYIFDVEYDLDYGLGNKLMSETYNLFVTNAAKAYFANIPSGSNIHLNEGDSINWMVRLKIRKA